MPSTILRYRRLDRAHPPGCTEVETNVAQSDWLNVDWSSDIGSPIQATPGMVSARVSCYFDGGGGFFVDKIYLSPTPAKY